MSHINPLLFAGAALVGVSVSPEVDAAAVTTYSSFVMSWASSSGGEEYFSFDPFAGPAADLVAVIFNLDSHIVGLSHFGANDGTSFVIMAAININPPTAASLYSPTNAATLEFDASVDLLDSGWDRGLFVGGPVDFWAFTSTSEGLSSGLWFAGEDPSPGGGGDIGTVPNFGSVSLTYVYDDSDDGPRDVPAPPTLPLVAGGLALLAIGRPRPRAR